LISNVPEAPSNPPPPPPSVSVSVSVSVPVPVTGSIRIVEVIDDPTDPNSPDGGSVVLSLGVNALTGNASLVGGQIVTRAALYDVKDVQVEFDADADLDADVNVDTKKGILVNDIDIKNKIGFTTNVCTVTEGRFNPMMGDVFIETAQCSATTCLQLDNTERKENCFFSTYGGTINVDAIKNTLGTDPAGIVIGGTGIFNGASGTFEIKKLVESEFPPEAYPVTNVLEVSVVLYGIDPLYEAVLF